MLHEHMATFGTGPEGRLFTGERSHDELPKGTAFARGLDLDRAAVDAAVTLPYHNGGTEGVDTKTKRIVRQMHGRASFDLLRHRILLG